MKPNAKLTRRTFVPLLGAALAPLLVRPAGALAGLSGRSRHPEPRPGIDGSKVLPADRVAPHVADLYDQVRDIPHIVDGLRCQCGCAAVGGMYSLLSCYEETGMAQYCEICQGEGRLAARLHGEGRSLDEIRAEIDRRFG